jgi:hypothetical protein
MTMPNKIKLADDLAPEFEEDIFSTTTPVVFRTHGLMEQEKYCVPIGEKYMISGEWYILAQTGNGYTLIGLKDGNRWSDPLRNFETFNHKITLEDFQQLLGSRHQEAREVLETRLRWTGVMTWKT